MTTDIALAGWRTRLGLLTLALAVVAAACAGSGESADGGGSNREAAGPVVPAGSFETFDGETVSLATYAGSPLVINFWASWCPSCVAEMATAFKPVQQALGERVTFLGMNIQDDRVRAEQLLEETGVQWISAEDPSGELYVELGGLGMPFTVFVSPAGEILDAHNGPLDAGQLTTRIEELLLG